MDGATRRLASGAVPDAATAAALEGSHLGALPADALRALVADASRLVLPAGSIVHRAGDDGGHLELVVSGLVRVFVTAQDGRTMTIRYCRPGALIGAVSLFASPFALPATIQTVTDTTLLALRASVVRRGADRDVRVARVLVDELSERVVSFIPEISAGAFTSIRQRVARHLLDLASEAQTGSMLVARVSQHQLAEAVGTSREVVVRVLGALRDEGVIRTSRGAIEVLDPERLAREEPAAGETIAPLRRNVDR
jgi:CRP/FNR family transcriptional regulator